MRGPRLTAWAGVLGLVATSVAAVQAGVGALPVGAATAAPAPVPPFACGQLSPGAPAAGRPVKATTALGDVQATISGTAATPIGEGIATVHNVDIDISVGGRVAVHGPLVTPIGRFIGPGGPALASLVTSRSSSDRPLCVADFGGSHPETAVLVGIFTMGAHCCYWVDAYLVGPGGAHLPPVQHQIGDPGMELRQLGGYTAVLTADDAFAYAFTAYAFSGMPLEILELRGTVFTNTTRQYPNLVAADAAAWWQRFEQAQARSSEDPTHGTGALAPWVADECLLSQGAKAWATVDRLNSEGKLSSKSADGWPSGTTYVKDLRTFLMGHGYCGS